MILTLVTFATVSCVTAPSSDTTARPTPAADLHDPVVAASLGSEPFDAIDWERRAGRWLIVGDGSAPQPGDIALIQAASNDVPAAITTEPRQLIRTASVGVPDDHPASSAVAVARGPDVFLLNAAFEGSDSATRWSVGRVLVHELVHVAQWYGLADAYVVEARDGKIPTLSLDDGSQLVADWASSTGWVDDDPDPLAAAWRLTTQAPNEYAETSPSEDMAESISLAAAGLGDQLDADRTAFIEAWAGVSIDQLSTGKPWAPAGATHVVSATDLYDTDWVSDVNQTDANHLDALYFEVPAGDRPAKQFANEVTAHLVERGLVGSLEATDTPGAFQGAFSMPDGSKLAVELIPAIEQESVLLIYVWLW